ncbi:MAG: hypothetical protein IJ987_07090 [Firmicutes bacterium]|nr:hypothetical protein [Bacillota bacterium]
MGLISKLPEVLTQAKIEYENLKSAPFVVGEEVGQSGNILAEGDNARFMKFLLDPACGHDILHHRGRRTGW